MTPVYEDNHIIIINKEPGEIVQGDKTGDTPLCDIVAQYLKEKYAKPGNVFCGVAHRLDRPVGGLVIFAKTSKALTSATGIGRTGALHHHNRTQQQKLCVHTSFGQCQGSAPALQTPGIDRALSSH